MDKKHCTITQSQMKEWYPEIVEAFKENMLDITAPLPELVIGTRATWERKRSSLVEQLQSHQIRPDGNGALEMIHGKNGDAILVYQHKLGNRVTSYDAFRHLIWHELGHFYAIHHEDPYLFRFMDQKPHPEEYEALRAYPFWAEFIAESIACEIEPEPEIDWATTDFYSTRNMLQYLLISGVQTDETEMIDWYSLAFYFARIISDKTVLGYCDAAENGTLKYRNGYNNQTIPFSESGIDPICLDSIDKSMLPVIGEITDILVSQLEKDNPCDISTLTLSRLGGKLLRIESLAQ